LTLKNIYLPLVISLFLYTEVSAQLVCNPNLTPTQAVQDVLLGAGVQAFNITFDGNFDQIGTFDCNNCGIGLESGVILATGSVGVAQGPNNSGSATIGGGNFGASDPDLDFLSTFFTNDAAILEFDFIPNGDSISFQYTFGSEEYNEYVCGSVNDAFGFFLSGPGINGPYQNNAINLAQVPNTNIPVTINTVNNGSVGAYGWVGNCSQVSPLWNQNTEYFVNNEFNGSPITVQFDGFTVILTASAAVQCGETYHIKIAIADAGDTAFDSGVFLKESSFSSPQIDVDLQIADLGANDSTIYEGCGTSYLIFSRSDNLPDAQSFDIDITGLATPGVDYTALPGSIDFPYGVYEVQVPFGAFGDGLIEGLEWVTISYVSVAACNEDEEFQSETFYIIDPAPLNAIIQDTEVSCGGSAILEPEITGGYGQYSIEWDTGETAFSIEVSPGVTTTYSFTVSDTCAVQPFIGEVTVTASEFDPILVDAGGPYSIGCFDNLEITAEASGGNGIYTYSWFIYQNGIPVVLGNGQTLQYDPDSEGTVYVTVTDQCGNTGEGSADYSFLPVPVVVNIGNLLEVICLEPFQVDPVVSGGVGSYTYTWTVDGVFLSDQPFAYLSADGPIMLELTVTDECGNTGDDDLQITVPPIPIIVDLGPDYSTTCLSFEDILPVVQGGTGNYVYEWTVNGIPSGSLPQLQVQALGNTQIELAVTDECGNIGSDNLQINVPPIPIQVDLGPDYNTACFDFEDIIPYVQGGTGNYVYEWTVNGNNAGSLPQIQIQALGNTLIELMVTDECGNSGIDELEIAVDPLPIDVDLGTDYSTTCFSLENIIPIVQGGTGNYEYEWTVNGTNAGSLAQIQIQAQGITLIELIVSDECGNVGSDELEISVDPVPMTVDVGPDLSVTCLDISTITPVVQGGIGNYSFSWEINGEDAGTGEFIDVSASSQTIIVLVVSDECGNSASDQMQISVPPVPIFADLGPDQSVTCTEPNILNPIVSGGIGDYSYTWYVNNLEYGNDETLEILVPEDAIVELVVNDECGNYASDELFLSVPDDPIIIEITPDTAVCLGEVVTLTALASGGYGGFTYVWPSLGEYDNSVTLTPTQNSSYTVIAEDICGNTGQASVTVGVEIMLANFDFDYEGDWGIQIYNGSSPQNSGFLWDFGDESFSTEFEPTHFYNDLYPHVITLYAISPNGCTDSISQIFYPYMNIFVPNAFTPNGDGVNDTFFALGTEVRSFEMWIFNRWGEELFYTDDINKHWTGNFDGGDYYVKDEVYTYRIKAVGLRGNSIEKFGSVTQLR